MSSCEPGFFHEQTWGHLFGFIGVLVTFLNRLLDGFGFGYGFLGYFCSKRLYFEAIVFQLMIMLLMMILIRVITFNSLIIFTIKTTTSASERMNERWTREWWWWWWLSSNYQLGYKHVCMYVCKAGVEN